MFSKLLHPIYFGITEWFKEAKPLTVGRYETVSKVSLRQHVRLLHAKLREYLSHSPTAGIAGGDSKIEDPFKADCSSSGFAAQ